MSSTPAKPCIILTAGEVKDLEKTQFTASHSNDAESQFLFLDLSKFIFSYAELFNQRRKLYQGHFSPAAAGRNGNHQ
jgi:hypothetical protein